MKKPIFTLTLALLILLSACVTDPIDTEQLPSGPLESEEVQIVSETPAPDGTQDPAQDEDTGIEKFINDQLTIIKEICDLHEGIKGLNKSLTDLYPIAVVENDVFYIFDINAQSDEYEFVNEYPSSMSLPENVLAAFPLDVYGGKNAAVVAANELKNLDNYAVIFHEFVHCYQFNNYSNDIKRNLTIEKQETAKNNYMWEINYPFPYEDETFIAMTTELYNASGETELESYINYHKFMKDHLQETDFEYMVWQEWQEGFARYVEDLICEYLGTENKNVFPDSLDRTCFYKIGSRYIELLIENDPALSDDLRELFIRISNYD